MEQSQYVDLCSERWLLEVIGGVGDPVGCLVFGALGGAVAGEQGLEDLRLLLHALDGPLGGGGRRRRAAFRRPGGG